MEIRYKFKSFKKIKKPKGIKFDINNISKLDIFMIYLVFLIMLNVFSMATMCTDTIAGDATYSYLKDSVFGEHEGASSVQSRMMISKVAIILKWVLPAMNVMAITLMVVSFAATIIFLSQPDFWTDVHMLKVLKNEIKDPNPAKKLLEMWRKSNGFWNFIKSMMPDVKMIAFYDAADIGEDGVPSLKTFFKYKIPKYMMIVAMLMCVNDQTLLELITKGGEAGAYLIRRGADIDYAAQIKGFIESGKDYDPGYRTVGTSRIVKNKKILFDKIYGALKKYNGIDSETITEEYKNAMGAKVREWVEQIAKTDGDSKGIDLTRSKMNVFVSIQPTKIEDTSIGMFQKPVVELSPKKIDSGYIAVQISFSEGQLGMTYHDTTDIEAWSGGTGDSVTSLTLDLSKVSVLSTLKPANGETYNYSVSATVKYIDTVDKENKEKIAEANVTVDNQGKKATINAPGNKEILGVTATITVTNNKGVRLTNMVYTYWKHPNLSGKLRTEAKTE